MEILKFTLYVLIAAIIGGAAFGSLLSIIFWYIIYWMDDLYIEKLALHFDDEEALI